MQREAYRLTLKVLTLAVVLFVGLPAFGFCAAVVQSVMLGGGIDAAVRDAFGRYFLLFLFGALVSAVFAVYYCAYMLAVAWLDGRHWVAVAAERFRFTPISR